MLEKLAVVHQFPFVLQLYEDDVKVTLISIFFTTNLVEQPGQRNPLPATASNTRPSEPLRLKAVWGKNKIAMFGPGQDPTFQKKGIPSRHPAQRRKFEITRMNAPSKVNMQEIGVSSKWSCQRLEFIEKVQKARFQGQIMNQALTLGPDSTGASLVWAARNSYWRSRGNWFSRGA